MDITNSTPSEKEKTALTERIRNKFRTSITAKLIMIGIVLLLCQIPSAMINGLRRDRMKREKDVEMEIASKWGAAQQITGPMIVVPVQRQREPDPARPQRPLVEHSRFHAAPENLRVSGNIIPETRYRGIYEVLLYRSEITLSGSFPANWASLPANDGWILPGDGATLLLGISDIKGISSVEVAVDGTVREVQPGFFKGETPSNGVLIPLPGLLKRAGEGKEVRFEVRLKLNGCRKLTIYPVGRTTEVNLTSSWASPSFTGGFLPEKRTVSSSGFSAEWVVNDFNRNCPVSWMGNGTFGPEHCVGVELVKPVNAYALVERAVSYDLLVCIIVLMALLTAERLTRQWVHPLQYMVAGLSLILFYSVLLALSEHIDFNAAYLAGTLIIAALGGFYARLIFGAWKTALGMVAVTILSYCVIFVILRLEDYALLAGSAVLVVLMAVLMAFTGKLNRLPE